MKTKRILLVLGGTWHKFDEFAAAMNLVFEKAGYAIETTRDLAVLAQLRAGRFDVVMMYTCLSATREDGGPAEVLFTDDHAAPLAEWVAGSGSLLMVHSGTVACQSSTVLRTLAGGVFIGHPPAFSFTVYPMFNEHAITAGVEAFSVFDEFYVERVEADVSVHMIAVDRGVAYPMVWSRREGKGRVANIAMGHDERVWSLPAYQRLLVQAADWLMGGSA